MWFGFLAALVEIDVSEMNFTCYKEMYIACWFCSIILNILRSDIMMLFFSPQTWILSRLEGQVHLPSVYWSLETRYQLFNAPFPRVQDLKHLGYYRIFFTKGTLFPLRKVYFMCSRKWIKIDVLLLENCQVVINTKNILYNKTVCLDNPF